MRNKNKHSELDGINSIDHKARRAGMSTKQYVRFQAFDNIQRWLESTPVNILIAILILFSVALIITEFLIPPGPRLEAIIFCNDMLTVVFCAELFLRGLVAPNKRIFFSNYWIDIIAVLPFFRFFRTLRVLRLLRAIRLARAATLLLRESGWLSSRLDRYFGNFGFLALCTILLVLCSSVALLSFEREVTGEAVKLSTVVDTVWKSSMLFVSGEVAGEPPITEGGKFVSLLTTLAGLIVFAIMVGTISAGMTNYLKTKMEARDLRLEDLRNHTLICGYDPKVDIILQELESVPEVWRRGVVVVAESDQPLFEKANLKNKRRLFHLNEDFTKIEVLEKAGVAEARTALVLADPGHNLGDQDRDARTVLAALTIEKINPQIFTCAELINEHNASHLKIAGVEEIVSRNNLSAGLFASSAVNEGISGIITDILTHKEGNYFRKLEVPEAYIGKTFLDLSNNFKEKYDALVIAVERKEESGMYEQHVNPNKDYILEEEDRITLIVKRDSEICDL